MYRKLAEDTHKSAGVGIWNVIRSHNLRKFFNSTLLNAGAQLFFVDYCMGHKIDPMHEAYFREDPIKMREIYQKYVPYLTIQKELDISTTPEFQRLQEENAAQAARIEELSVEQYQIQELQKQIERLGSLVDPQALAKDFIENHKKSMETDPEYRKKFLDPDTKYLEKM